MDPHTIDPRTAHEAMPVIAGIKYGANAWVSFFNSSEFLYWSKTGVLARFVHYYTNKSIL
jgi:predicted GH43/DUF377 family glycosyl hydrolase